MENSCFNAENEACVVMEEFFNVKKLFSYIKRKLWFLGLNLILVSACAFFFVTNFVEVQYMSHMTFLPPTNPKSVSSMFPLATGLSLNSNFNVSSEQVVSIFEAHSMKKKVIEKFDLINKYELNDSKNKIGLAMKKLGDDLLLEVEEKGSFGVTQILSLKLVAYHTSADTASEMVTYVYGVLDSTIKDYSSEHGRLNKEFILTQLQEAQRKLDSVNLEYQTFQKENKLFDIKTQLEYSFETYSSLKTKLLQNEIKLANSKKSLGGQHSSVQQLREEVKVLRKHLKVIENGLPSDVLIGLNKSIELYPQYLSLQKSIESHSLNLASLQRQYESAHLSEVNTISRLKVIDDPYPAEYKSRPKRAVMILSIVFVYMVFVVSFIMLRFFLQLYNKDA